MAPLEVVVFIAMMIVPFISIASLFIAIRCDQKNRALKQLVISSLNEGRQLSARDKALQEFRVNEI